jgi:hypothetical protein
VPPTLPFIIEALFVAQNLIFSHKPLGHPMCLERTNLN